MAQLQAIKEQAIKEIEEAADLKILEVRRTEHLGKKSPLTQALRGLGSLPSEERRSVGQVANKVRDTLQAALETKRAALAKSDIDKSLVDGQMDVTLPGWPLRRGHLHPTTQVVREICDAFVAMGFSIVEGPEVELDFYNFEALNIPEDHPARDMWNSLWIDSGGKPQKRPMLLRTHTSPMQIGSWRRLVHLYEWWCQARFIGTRPLMPPTSGCSIK